MKKFFLMALVCFGAMFMLTSCGYNTMVTMDEEVTAAWSNVENQYQRRSDLIPNLVNTVKGYASHESKTLQDVTEARANATKVTIDASNLNEESMKQFSQAQSQVTSALSRLLAVSENYPELKANQNFLELQAQLEGTENRISTERRKFNETVRNYNVYIRKFPRNLVAMLFSFTPKAYFEAEEGSEKAPEVKF